MYRTARTERRVRGFEQPSINPVVELTVRNPYLSAKLRAPDRACRVTRGRPAHDSDSHQYASRLFTGWLSRILVSSKAALMKQESSGEYRSRPSLRRHSWPF